MSALTPEEIRVLAREITDKVRRELAVPQLRPGTVLSYEGDSSMGRGTAIVHLDGDPPDAATAAVSLVEAELTLGGRVMVLFQPPYGVFVAWATTCSEDTFTFSYANPTVDYSAPYEVRYGIRAVELVGLLSDAVSGDTIIELWLNGAVAATVTIPDGALRGYESVQIDCEQYDTIQANIQQVGTGETRLSFLVRYVSFCSIGEPYEYVPPGEA